MINLNRLPIVIGILSILIYNVAGDNTSNNWNGFYFCSNYFTVFFLFKSYKYKQIRYTGMTLSLSLFLFAIIKFFTKFDCERIYTLIPFTIILTYLIFVNKWKK